MSPDEIGMVRTIEREIGQEIPRISVPGFDFGTVSRDRGRGHDRLGRARRRRATA